MRPRRPGQPPIAIENEEFDTTTEYSTRKFGHSGTDCGAENMSEQFWITMVFLLLSFVADVFLLSLSRWNVEHLNCGGGNSVPCVAVIPKPWYVPDSRIALLPRRTQPLSSFAVP
jgi:hypothetical protein